MAHVLRVSGVIKASLYSVASRKLLMGIQLADKTKLRRDYSFGRLSRSDLDASPLVQFSRWFAEAENAGLVDVSAMALATSSQEGKPTVRIVLLKHFDESGFCWYTDYESTKGLQLAANNCCEVLFYWKELDRQVRISGKVNKTSDEESASYFDARPLESQAATIASEQSQPIESRPALENRYDIAVASEGGLERPVRWGGYRLMPEQYEFWQGREARLHDRFRYNYAEEEWSILRLQP